MSNASFSMSTAMMFSVLNNSSHWSCSSMQLLSFFCIWFRFYNYSILSLSSNFLTFKRIELSSSFFLISSVILNSFSPGWFPAAFSSSLFLPHTCWYLYYLIPVLLSVFFASSRLIYSCCRVSWSTSPMVKSSLSSASCLIYHGPNLRLMFLYES